MSGLTLGHKYASSELYVNAINKEVPYVYQNRAAWVAPSRVHWLNSFAKSSPTMAFAATFGITLMAAGGIVNFLGGSRYGRKWHH